MGDWGMHKYHILSQDKATLLNGQKHDYAILEQLISQNLKIIPIDSHFHHHLLK